VLRGGPPSGQTAHRPCHRRAFTGQPSHPIFSHHDHRNLLPQAEAGAEVKPAQPFPIRRIETAKPPRKRHYGEILDGVPDEAQHTELVRQFIERTLGKEQAIT
jgi:hypothetical protein